VRVNKLACHYVVVVVVVVHPLSFNNDHLGGESIKEINRKSGAFVELDKSHMPAVGNSGDRLFKIRGTPDQIAAAQQYMYERVTNTPSGSADLMTPLQFQQKYNLPLVNATSADSWAANNDPYGNNGNSNDVFNQWANVYGQWPQSKCFIDSIQVSTCNINTNRRLVNPYDDGTGKTSTGSSSAPSSSSSNPAGMGQMDPAWLAYYQSMNLYNMMQTSMTGNTSSSTSSNKPADSTENGSSTIPGLNSCFLSYSSVFRNEFHWIYFSLAASATAGQADYSQQWIEYYRSMGQNDLADQIAVQMKEVKHRIHSK
jgi:far upstream element-binding protein